MVSQDWQEAACQGEDGLRAMLAQAAVKELALRDHSVSYSTPSSPLQANAAALQCTECRKGFVRLP